MPQSPGHLTIPGPPLFGQIPKYSATGLGARLLTNGTLSATSSATIAASISPLTSVVFISTSARTPGTAPKILNIESSLGGPWREIVTTAAGAADRRLSLWVGTGLSGSGTITVNLDIPAAAGRYTVFEFTGIDAVNPWVASNVQLNNGSSTASSLTPNALQSGHNAYLAVTWHNSAEDVVPKLIPSEEIFDSNSVTGDGHELNYYVGWNGGSMGATWQLVATYRALGVEISYDPTLAPPPTIFPRRPETFPKGLNLDVLDATGPPLLARQPMPMDIPAIGGDITILPAAALATADGLVPTLTVTVLPAIAGATADALVPTLQVTVLPAIATATADAPAP